MSNKITTPDVGLKFFVMESHIDYFCKPDELTQKLEYKKHPEWGGWLTSFLACLQGARYCIGIWEQENGAISKETLKLEKILQRVRKGIERNKFWVREQLRCELNEKLEAYEKADNWIEIIESDIEGEYWYLLNERDSMESHIVAPINLHAELVPDIELVKRIHEVDKILRQVGTRLWSISPPTLIKPSDRWRNTPPSHWWWWLDQKELPG